MPRRLLICLIALLLVCTSCAGPPRDVNIVCFDFEKDMIGGVYRFGSAHDDSLAPVNCITEKDYVDYGDWYDSLFTELLARSDNIDIYLLNSTDERAYKILKDHYYVDLAQDAKLMEYYDAMYPEIRDWCTFDDEVFGFPFSVFYNMQTLADEEKMRSVGYTLEDIRTVDGLLGFCDAWTKNKHSSPTEGMFYLRLYCDNYLMSHYDRDTGELNIDTPELRSILTQCRQYQDNEYLRDEPSSSEVDLAKPLLFLTGNPLVDKESYDPAYYPLLEGETPGTKRFADVWYFVINPASKNKEQAMKYMELLAEAVKYNGKGFSLLYQDREFYHSYLYAGTNNVTHDWFYSEEELEKVDAFLDDAYVGYGFPGYHKIRAILDRYIAGGDQTLDETIAEAQDLLDTIREEQYIGE